MKKIVNCVECGFDFDLYSYEKRKIGGRINTCCDCSEETAVRYAGVQSADGKSSQATILKFSSDKDRDSYVKFWQNNSGLHRGKVCSLGNHLSSDPGISFQTVVGFTPTNHKGKA